MTRGIRSIRQAVALGAAAFGLWSVPVLAQALVRIRATNVQSGLKGAERAANVQGAFRAVGLLPIGLPVSVSIGVATHRRGDAAEDLFRRADQALYEAKRGGRDRVVAAD